MKLMCCLGFAAGVPMGHARPPTNSPAISAAHHLKGSSQDFDIDPEAPVLDVLEIQRDVRFKRRIAPCLHLPQAGDAGLHVEPPQMLDGVAFVIVEWMRAWPNQAHVAEQYVHQLR